MPATGLRPAVLDFARGGVAVAMPTRCFGSVADEAMWVSASMRSASEREAKRVWKMNASTFGPRASARAILNLSFMVSSGAPRTLSMGRAARRP